jgi:hypothetical protein
MPWFKVDDSFHSHPKVLAAAPAALGLWVVAGSWSGANLSDGFVPDHVLPRLLPDAESLARQLVSAGLWKRIRGGYRFHDWAEFNPSSETVQAERAAARERMRAMRARRKEGTSSEQQGHIEQSLMEGRAGDQKQASGTYVPGRPRNRSPEHGANVRELFVTPTRPDPNKDLLALSDSPTPRTREQCSRHRGQPAGRCGLCRSEALGAE